MEVFKLTNLTIFAALLRDIPMGCKDAVLPESLLKSHTVNCLTYEQNIKKPYKDNLCLFRALALHLHGNKKLEEETSKLFNLFLVNSTNPDPSKFQGVCMDDIPSVEDIVGINIFLYDINLIDGAMVGELARRSIKKYEKQVQLIQYNSHICYATISMHSSRLSALQLAIHIFKRLENWSVIWSAAVNV